MPQCNAKVSLHIRHLSVAHQSLQFLEPLNQISRYISPETQCSLAFSSTSTHKAISCLPRPSSELLSSIYSTLSRSSTAASTMSDQDLWGFHFPEDPQLTSRALYPPSDRSGARSTSAASVATSPCSNHTGPAISSTESMGGHGSVAESLAQFSFEGSGESNSSKSPLNMGLGFFKNLTEKKTTRGMSDG